MRSDTPHNFPSRACARQAWTVYWRVMWLNQKTLAYRYWMFRGTINLLRSLCLPQLHMDHTNIYIFHRAHEYLVTLVLYTCSIILFWLRVLRNSIMISTLLRCCVILFMLSVVAIIPELLALGVNDLGKLVNPVSLHTTLMAYHALCPDLRLCKSYTRFTTRVRTPLRHCADVILKLLKKL